MTTLLTALGLSKAYGTQVLFKDINLTFSEGERVGLIGPNGAGKSSLIKILAGMEMPDKGSVSRRRHLAVGYASQSPTFPDVPLEEFLGGDLVKARVLLGKAEFLDFRQKASTLSGGWKKRLDIVAALMQDPELLFLDEPTNHLDLEGIQWLERFLKRVPFSYVVISHDRYFLENVTTKIIELNPCYPEGFFVSEGNMSKYLEHKNAFLAGQEKREKELKAKVKNETDWLNTSPKARTTKSRSRIQQAYELMEDFDAVKRRNKVERVGIDFSASERQTRKLLVAKNIKMGSLFQNIDVTLSPGTRLGIVGKNGSGKTTMLRTLAKEIKPDMGTIKYADDLKLVYFDQHREKVDEKATLKTALCPHGETVNYRGQKIHVNGWGKRFLFSPDRMNLPVSCLSGGEKARILIAKLMLEPADILFLDEPTNDLDIETLEVIEESLISFNGAVVMISHDRCMMDRICTSVLALGTTHENPYFADYSQWEESLEETVKKPVKAEVAKEKAKGLSYKEKRELEGMEEAIVRAEAELEAIQKKLEVSSDLELYKQMGEIQQRHDTLYERWHELEKKNS